MSKRHFLAAHAPKFNHDCVSSHDEPIGTPYVQFVIGVGYIAEKKKDGNGRGSGRALIAGNVGIFKNYMYAQNNGEGTRFGNYFLVHEGETSEPSQPHFEPIRRF